MCAEDYCRCVIGTSWMTMKFEDVKNVWAKTIENPLPFYKQLYANKGERQHHEVSMRLGTAMM